jgi:bifunctional non-homologous end joining protein LigD
MSRKELLSRIVPGSGFIRVLDHIEGDGRALFDFCRRQRLEGVVGKRQSSVYRPGPNRTSDWIKVKCERDDDFIVFGWSEGKNARERLGALCLASYRGDELVYRGRAGSGLDEETIDHLLEVMKPLEIAKSRVLGPLPAESARGHFLEPKLVAQVRYLGFSDDGHLREPVFLGLRPDVDPRNCTVGPPTELPNPEDSIAAAVEAQNSPERQHVTVTNRHKVFWPDDGYTKGDLCDYYAAIAPAMLPYLDGRPIVLVRYPDGINGKNFFQWHVPAGTPDWIRRLQIRDPEDQSHKGPKTVFLVDSVDGLVHIANLGCIPIHVLAARERSLDECDFLTVDFDIGERPFADAVTLALELKSLLDEIGLAGYPKTSGQKGLHVLVPVGPGISFDAAKLLVELLGRLVTSKHPDIATMERRVSKRGPRVFVDTGQTGRSRTIVAPYSLRAVPGATASTPLFWNEVHAGLDPARFNLASVPVRVAELGDPMRGFLDQRPDIQSALVRISSRLPKGSE